MMASRLCRRPASRAQQHHSGVCRCCILGWYGWRTSSHRSQMRQNQSYEGPAGSSLYWILGSWGWSRICVEVYGTSRWFAQQGITVVLQFLRWRGPQFSPGWIDRVKVELVGGGKLMGLCLILRLFGATGWRTRLFAWLPRFIIRKPQWSSAWWD